MHSLSALLLHTPSAGAAAAVRRAFFSEDDEELDGGGVDSARSGGAAAEYFVWPSGVSDLSSPRAADGLPPSILLRSALAATGGRPERSPPTAVGGGTRRASPATAPKTAARRSGSSPGLYARDREIVLSTHDPRAHWP